jgi:uncharacterized protein
VGLRSIQPESSCLGLIWGLDRPSARPRQRLRAGYEQAGWTACFRWKLRGSAVLRDNINNAVKDAMKARDERRVSTLRMVNAAIKNADIEARGQGKEPLNEADLMSLFQKMIKQRQESADLYEKGGRPELAAQEKAEIEIITSYLPQQMSDVEAGAAISSLLQELNAETMKDMGRAMAALRERFAGKMDFGKASGKIKELLNKK